MVDAATGSCALPLRVKDGFVPRLGQAQQTGVYLGGGEGSER